MNSIKFTSILVTVVSAAFAAYDDNITIVGGSDHEFVPYADLNVPNHFHALYSWPLGHLSDCGRCAQSGCWSGRHRLSVGAVTNPDRAYGEGDHGCQNGWCSEAHPESASCTTGGGTTALSDADKQRIWDSAIGKTPSSLANIVEAFGEDAVAYNSSRNAIQVSGCDGSVIMSIPVSGAQSSALGL